MAFSCCSIPMTFVAVWAFAKYSTSFILRSAATLQFIGATFRLLTVPTGWFWPILLGNILQACAAPFIINSQVIICNKWFADKERALATSLLTVAMPLGTALAFVQTGIFYKDDNQTPEENRASLCRQLEVQGVIYVFIFIFFLVVFREKPEHPPSAVAEVPVQNLKLVEAFSVMKQNKSYLLLCLSFALMYGFYLSFGVMISNIFTPFGLTPNNISLVGLYLLLSGIFGAVIIGAFVDRTALYKSTMVILSIVNIVFLAIINQTLYHIDNNYTILVTACVLMGFSSVSYIPLCLSFAAELTFPLQPAMVNGGMLLAGQASAFMQSVLYAFSLDVKTTYSDGSYVPDDVLLAKQQDRSWWTFFMMIIISSISVIASLFIKEDLKRLNHSFRQANPATSSQKTFDASIQVNDDDYKRATVPQV